MDRTAFVAPLFRGNTRRFLTGFLELEDTSVAVIGMEDEANVPRDLRERMATYVRVRDAGDPEQLVGALRTIRSTVGATDSLNGFLEQLQEPLAVARAAMGIPGLDPEAARRFRDKDAMKACLRAAGLPVARSVLCRSAAEARRFVDDVGWPVVVKPPSGAGAKATFRATSDATLADAFGAFGPGAGPVQVEEFVTAREQTCETVFVDGRPVWRSGTHYIPGPLQVLENPWMQYAVVLPREVDDPDFTAFHAISDAALTALGLRTGLAHMEWFQTADGRMLVNEVGARPPGANIVPLMSLAHDADLWALWARLMVKRSFAPPERRWAAGTCFFRGQGTGRVVAVHGLAEAQAEVGRYVVDVSLPQTGQAKASGYEGEGWAIVKAATTAEVVHALGRLVQTVKVELG